MKSRLTINFGFRNIFLLLAIMIPVASCKTPKSSSDLKRGSREIDEQRGFKLGKGSFSLFGIPKQVCIDFDGVSVGVVSNSTEGQTTSFNMMLIESQASLAQNMDLSSNIGLQIKTGGLAEVSGKAKFAFQRGAIKETTSVYLLVSMKVKGRTSTLINPRLKPEIKKELEGNLTPKVIRKIVDRCGDEYLESATEGGEFYGVIEIETSSAEEKKKVATSLNASAILQSGIKLDNSNSVNSDFELLTKGKKINSWSFQRGGSGVNSIARTTVKEILERAVRLPELVVDGVSTKVLSGYFNDYFSLGIEINSEHLASLKRASRTIDKLSNALKALEQKKLTILKVLADPGGFRNSQVGTLKTILRKIEETTNEIVVNSRNCEENYLNCTYGVDLESIQFVEPEPLASVFSKQFIENINYDSKIDNLRCYSDSNLGEITHKVTRIQVYFIEEGVLEVRLWKRRSFIQQSTEVYRVSPYLISPFFLKVLGGSRQGDGVVYDTFVKRGVHFLTNYVFNSPLPGNTTTELKRCEHY